MQEERRAAVIESMTANLPVLRAKLNISQAALAEKLDVSRQQIVAIENGKRRMTWTTYLALYYLMNSNPETKPLLAALGITAED